MCQSKAEGGRRCYTHLHAAYSRAAADLTKADAKVSELITAQATVLRDNGGRISGNPEAVGKYAQLQRQLKQAQRRQVTALDKADAARNQLMETDRGYQDALDEADALDASTRNGTLDVHARRAARNDAARLRLAAETAHGNARPTRRDMTTGPARVGEPSEVSDMVAFMQDAGYTRFIVFDDEPVTRNNIIVMRNDDDLASALRGYPTKGAARLRRADGTWPGPQPRLPLSEEPRTPPVVS